MPRRRDTKPKTNTPEAIAARLPEELRSFDAWLYDTAGDPTGLKDYLAALSARVAPHEPLPVMNAAGLSAAGWFQNMLTSAASTHEQEQHHGTR